MSHIRRKVNFKTEGTYGSTLDLTLYVDQNLSCDCVTFYDNDGSLLFSYCEAGHPDMGDAIIQLLTTSDDFLAVWDAEDFKKIEDKNK